MKVSSATDSNNNSLVVEEKDEEATSGVEIIATETEESLSADATKAGANGANDIGTGHQKPKPRLRLITVGSLGFAAAAVLGIASFAGSSIHSSKQQVVAALMNNVQVEVDGYNKFEGDGACVDGSGNRYDFIAFYGITTPQACGERCSDCPGKNDAGLVFLGFSYDGDCGDCHCLVDDVDGADYQTLIGACEGNDGAASDFLGSGEIQGATGYPDFVCYKKTTPPAPTPPAPTPPGPTPPAPTPPAPTPPAPTPPAPTPPAPTPPNSKAAKRAKRANAEEDTTIQASFMKSGGTFLSPLISASATLAWIMALSTFFTFFV